MDTLQIWKGALQESQRLLNEFVSDEAQLEKCKAFTDLMVRTIQDNGNVFFCGNGGSHCDAMHAAEEFTGRFRENRRPIGALALGDPAHVTCVGNDFGFEHVFSRQLEGLGRRGDLLVVLSTSGNSKNLGNALAVAREKGIHSVALLGRDGGWMKDTADLTIIIPGKTSDRIQELHIKLLHTVIEATEHHLFKR